MQVTYPGALGAYLLGGADGARTHANPQTISAGFYQAPCLSASDHIACYDLESWMRLFQMLQHLCLVCGVTCRQQQALL